MLGAIKKKPPEGGFPGTARGSVDSRLLDGSSGSVGGLLGDVGCSSSGTGSSAGRSRGSFVHGTSSSSSCTSNRASGSGCCVCRGSGSSAGCGRCSVLHSLNSRSRCWHGRRSWHFLFFSAGSKGSGSNDGSQNIRLLHDSIDLMNREQLIKRQPRKPRRHKQSHEFIQLPGQDCTENGRLFSG